MTKLDEGWAWSEEVLDELAETLSKLKNRSNGTDFFAVRIKSELERVTELIERAAVDGELELRDGHSRSELVLEESFLVPMPFRGIHFLSDSRFMSSYVVRNWAERVEELIQQNRITSVRRLMIYSDADELTSSSSREYMRQNLNSQGYEIRTLSKKTLKFQLLEHRVSVPHDFGVYGNLAVFFSASADPSDLAGTWLKDSERVKDFIAAFDDCWNLAEPENKNDF